jgi:hypothetical protein
MTVLLSAKTPSSNSGNSSGRKGPIENQPSGKVYWGKEEAENQNHNRKKGPLSPVSFLVSFDQQT